jgi:hypothetical protein
VSDEQKQTAEILSRNEKIRKAIEVLRQLVEIALQEKLGVGERALDGSLIFKKQLSTIPEQVDSDYIDRDLLWSKCDTLSSELQRNLIEMGINIDRCQNAIVDDISDVYNPHIFLRQLIVIDEEEVEIIIDPSIGQYLVGHNHVFIGTRQQLKELIETQAGEGKPYQLTGITYHDKAYEEIYGTESIVKQTRQQYLDLQKRSDAIEAKQAARDKAETQQWRTKMQAQLGDEMPSWMKNF